MRKSREIRKAAAEHASAAAEYGQQALKEGVAKAQDALAEGLEQAQVLLEQAQKQAGPAIKDAKVRTATFAARQLDAVEPTLREALDRVTPAVDAARMKVADELLPKLSEQLHAAAEQPKVLAEVIAPKPKRSRGRSLLKFLAVGAIVAGAVAAIRHFLSPKDDGWTAHEPSRAYVNNNDTFATAAQFTTPAAAEQEQEQEDVQEAAAEMVSEGAPAPEVGETVADDAAKPEDVVEAEESVEADAKYGPDAFVGEEPPADYTIKGNERSKKYHVPGSGGYERTVAEVWFKTEEAAQAAGFTKAQR